MQEASKWVFTLENDLRMLIFDGGSGMKVVKVANKQSPSKTSMRVLVFDGRSVVVVVEVANKQPPSKASTRMLVVDGGGQEHLNTLKNKCACTRF